MFGSVCSLYNMSISKFWLRGQDFRFDCTSFWPLLTFFSLSLDAWPWDRLRHLIVTLPMISTTADSKTCTEIISG